MPEIFGIVIEANAQYGTLVAYSPPSMRSYYEGKTATAYALDSNGRRQQQYYATFTKYKTGGSKPAIAAVFPQLPVGNYEVTNPDVYTQKIKRVTVFPGYIAEVTF